MHRALAPLALLALLAVACGGSGSKEQEPPKTPEETAERFLSLWKERKYNEMYDLVSSEAKLNIAGDKFVELDDRSLVHFFTRVPRRGGIYDRNGKELGIDGSVAVIGIVKDFITDPEATIARLTQASGLPEPEIRAKVQHNQPSYYFIPVKTLPYGAPPEEVQKYRDMVDLGVVVREETQRVYPNGASAAHIVGYMT